MGTGHATSCSLLFMAAKLLIRLTVIATDEASRHIKATFYGLGLGIYVLSVGLEGPGLRLEG